MLFQQETEKTYSSLPLGRMLGWGLLVVWLGGCSTLNQPPDFDTPEEHYGPIMERQKAGIESAEDLLASIPEKTPQEYEKLGDAHASQNEIAMALIQYSKSLKLDPKNAQLRFKFATLLLNHGKPKEAHLEFEEILQHDVMFAQAYEGMGQALLQMEKDDEASQQFRRALSFDPKLWRSHNFLGILADRRHLHLSAIEAYKSALRIKPNDPSVLNNLGMAYYMDGQYKEAVRTFHFALKLDSSPTKISNNLGLALAKMKRFPESFDAFRKGNNEAMAYNNIGIALLEAGNPQRAISCFKKAIETQPSYYEKANENLNMATRMLSNNPKSHRKSSQNTQCL